MKDPKLINRLGYSEADPEWERGRGSEENSKVRIPGLDEI